MKQAFKFESHIIFKVMSENGIKNIDISSNEKTGNCITTILNIIDLENIITFWIKERPMNTNAK